MHVPAHCITVNFTSKKRKAIIIVKIGSNKERIDTCPTGNNRMAFIKQKKPTTVEHTANIIIFNTISKLSGTVNSPRIIAYTKYITAHIIHRYVVNTVVSISEVYFFLKITK